ncbi:cyclic nucleotide-binding/CBS domain-containing protein [Halomicroarcula sp. GCM10025324]|jgi:signal-transduction protein with cAMP-binding, CBS, and nucleotidyltransferase domain|uniref:CBS domain-containing protein n=1 Tax=Haloarcula TaxID=2237 RepID=UPI0023E7BF24|nr:CBS domain-containing protein [Halomicroarcula sp. ZS-22-S1]
MHEMYVDQLMSRPLETVAVDTPVIEAAGTLIAQDVGAVVVDDGDQLAGILTATDFVRMVRDEGVSSDATVGEFMHEDVVTTTRSRPVSEVAAKMLDHGIHHVPVVDDGEVVGIITTMDLTAHLSRSLSA